MEWIAQRMFPWLRDHVSQLQVKYESVSILIIYKNLNFLPLLFQIISQFVDHNYPNCNPLPWRALYCVNLNIKMHVILFFFYATSTPIFVTYSFLFWILWSLFGSVLSSFYLFDWFLALPFPLIFMHYWICLHVILLNSILITRPSKLMFYIHNALSLLSNLSLYAVVIPFY